MTGFGVTLVAALASLAGSEWGLGSEAKPKQYVRFTESEVSGHAGCNSFFGRYMFVGGEIMIGPLASTQLVCGPDVMDTERKWMAMLESARIAEASREELVLKNKAGATVGRLVRRN